MGMEQATLDAVIAAIDDPLADDLVSRLRGNFPGVTFTVCNDDDVLNAEPVKECDGFNIYLINTSSHCLSLTRELDSAAGVLIAWLPDDD